MIYKIFFFLFGTAWLFVPVYVLSQTTDNSFSFTLKTSSKTSAGIFKNDGTLVRTLWSGVNYEAGTYKMVWDYKNDSGKIVPKENYSAKVLSNNVSYQWEGASIGNTSDSISGDTKLHGFDIINTMAITGAVAYCGTGYSENNSSEFKVDLSNVGQKKYILQQYHATSQGSFYTATDGINVYWAGGSALASAGSAWYTFATKVSDDTETMFSNGSSLQTSWGRNYLSVIDRVDSNNGRILGLAVQKTHNYLFVAYVSLNEIHVVNKTTGALVQIIKTFISPRQLTMDVNDDLWIISGSNTVSKHTVDNDGTISAAVLTLSGLLQPLALGVSYHGATIVVADGSTSQQLKAFNNTSGTPSWTFGTVGGYLSDPTVKNDKFYFNDVGTNVRLPFICFESNGSFWVSDPGNYRVQHFAAGRTFINRIMFLPHSYSIRVDKNNSTRVFNEYLEFAVDYSKTLDNGSNGSWKLNKNWRGSITSDQQILNSIMTLRNGRTYALLTDQINHIPAVVELPPTGPLRFTGIKLDAYSNQTICQDGSLRCAYGMRVGEVATWYKQILNGFDSSNNPLWGEYKIVASTKETTAEDPLLNGHFNPLPNSITSNNILISFNGGLKGGYHLGGIREGDSAWLWKTAITMPGGTSNTNYFPYDGRFDIGNGIARPGTTALAVEHSIIWGYGGEFWRGYQINKFNHVYDNGLFVGQFGIMGVEVYGLEAPAMMAGNSFVPEMVKVGDDYYLYHNDEFWHSGIHRWKISGLNTIQEQTIPISGTVANAGDDKTIILPANSTDLNGSGTDADGTITRYKWSQVSGPNNAIFNSDTSANVKVSALIAGTYVFSLVVTNNQQSASAPDQITVTVSSKSSSSTSIYRINAGGGQVTTSKGIFFADGYYSPSPGDTYSDTSGISGTTDDAIYQMERTGNTGTFGYAFPVSNGKYTVVLHFAEIYYGGPENRIFDVTAEGTKFLDNYDIFKKAGRFTATSESFGVNVTDGFLNINFSSLSIDGGKDRPKISAIEILSDSSSQAFIPSAEYQRTFGPAESLQELSATVRPNPSTQNFNLYISGNNQPADVKIFNAVGQLIETRSNLRPGYPLNLGNNYRSGLFYAVITQGNSKVILKLIKQRE